MGSTLFIYPLLPMEAKKGRRKTKQKKKKGGKQKIILCRFNNYFSFLSICRWEENRRGEKVFRKKGEKRAHSNSSPSYRLQDVTEGSKGGGGEEKGK